MAALDPALKRRAKAAETKREAFAALMKDIYAFAMPERDAWNSYALGSDRTAPRVYDSTAVIATGRFANRLQQAMFPPAQRWAALEVEPSRAEEIDDAVRPLLDRTLEDATALLFAHLADSNFDQVVNEWAMDLAAGVGCMLVENGRLSTRRPGAPLFRFQAVPAGLVAFDEGPLGTVEGVFVTQRMPARLVARTYPDATLPKHLADLARDEPEKPVELLQATVYDDDDDLWRMVIAERKGDEVLAERTYRTNPWIVTRWSKSPGEAHGRGPLAAALPDIRVLNKVVELYLANASLATYGVYTVLDDGVVNPATVQIVPGAMIPVGSNGGPRGRSIEPLRSGVDVALAQDLMEKLKTAIRQTMFDNPLPPEVQAGITATEIEQRMRLFWQETGAFGRLQADALTPLVDRLVDVMEEAGLLATERFKHIRPALEGGELRVRAVSPLAQAQDRADVQAVMGFIAGAASLGQLGQAIIERGIDMNRAGPWLAERTGVPAALVPTEEELAERARQAEEAEAMRTAAQSPVLGQVVGNLMPAMAGQEGA